MATDNHSILLAASPDAPIAEEKKSIRKRAGLKPQLP
jgi:hypothetical protein